MREGTERFALTPQGVQAMRGAAPALDVDTLKILTLIQQGCTQIEAILQRSKLRRDDLLQGLRKLLGSGLIVVTTAAAPAAAAPAAAAPVGANALRGRFALKRGISPSQARFILTNFCLDQFGPGGQALAEVIDLCAEVTSLQQAVNNIRSEVEKRIPERLPLLLECVREINETDF